MHIYRYNTAYICAILDFMPVKAITASFLTSDRLLRQCSGAYPVLYREKNSDRQRIKNIHIKYSIFGLNFVDCCDIIFLCEILQGTVIPYVCHIF